MSSSQYKYLRFVTARKRSLGQGNVFTRVCHSVHGGWGLHSGGSASGRSASRGDLHQGGLYPGGGSASRRGICIQEGGGSSSRRGVCIHEGDLHPGGGSASKGVCLQGGLHLRGLHPRGIGQTPPSPSDTTGYSQQTGSMHSSGMHSC